MRYIFWHEKYMFIYRVDFVFHEAGHLIFGIFGKFIGDLGGTLMQLLLPTAVFFSFLKSRQFHSASLILFWIGENWINISIYAKDARARILPLHGGESVTHDWSEILLTLNLLHHDQFIGNLFYFLGIVFMIAGLGFGLYFCFKSPKEPFDA